MIDESLLPPVHFKKLDKRARDACNRTNLETFEAVLKDTKMLSADVQARWKKMSVEASETMEYIEKTIQNEKWMVEWQTKADIKRWDGGRSTHASAECAELDVFPP
jgi:hypothetical protein